MLALALVWWLLHDFHTSITELNYNIKEKTFEASLRVFSDDLETTITARNNGIRPIKWPKEKLDALYLGYLKDHFQLIAKNRVLPIELVGTEIEGDATWFYIAAAHADKLQGVQIKNTVLLDQFEDQTNIVNLVYGPMKKSYLFNQKNKLAEIE